MPTSTVFRRRRASWVAALGSSARQQRSPQGGLIGWCRQWAGRDCVCFVCQRTPDMKQHARCLRLRVQAHSVKIESDHHRAEGHGEPSRRVAKAPDSGQTAATTGQPRTASQLQRRALSLVVVVVVSQVSLIVVLASQKRLVADTACASDERSNAGHEGTDERHPGSPVVLFRGVLLRASRKRGRGGRAETCTPNNRKSFSSKPSDSEKMQIRRRIFIRWRESSTC